MNSPTLRTAFIAATLLAAPGCQKESVTLKEQEVSADAGADSDASTETQIAGNKPTTDAFNAAIADCLDDSWNRLIDCQEQQDGCVNVGRSQEECAAAYDTCEATANDADEACMQATRDIAGCDFTESKNVDSDRDGLSDSKELHETFTNPCDQNSCGATPDGERDTDGDGVVDAQDEAPVCRPVDVHCGDPLRPVEESACRLDSEK